MTRVGMMTEISSEVDKEVNRNKNGDRVWRNESGSWFQRRGDAQLTRDLLAVSAFLVVGSYGYLWVTTVVMEKSLFGLCSLGVVTQQFDDALLLRQRHASLDQTLWSLPQYDSLVGRNFLPGCWILEVYLLPQHAVDAAAARRLGTERVEVVETQNVAKIHQTRSTNFLRRTEVGRRLPDRYFVVGWRHADSTSGDGNRVELAVFPAAKWRHDAGWRHWMMKLIRWRHCGPASDADNTQSIN